MGTPEHPHADWLDRHRFYSLGHLVEQLQSLFQHDTDNDGQIVVYTDYAEAPEGAIVHGAFSRVVPMRHGLRPDEQVTVGQRVRVIEQDITGEVVGFDGLDLIVLDDDRDAWRFDIEEDGEEGTLVFRPDEVVAINEQVTA
jgi:hypothetical protein|tara:strand:- start:9073 stop:9495 length:423 start_codon:yes stop_codon:yes gene_type:complete